MSDPWTSVQATIAWEVPQWIIDYYQQDNPDLEVDAEWVVTMWLENMECNIYDVAREEGRAPEPSDG